MKKIRYFIVLGMIALLLSSCRNHEYREPSKAEEEETTLLVFYEMGADISVVMFQKQYPDYDAKFVPFNAYDDLESTIAKEGKPDVILAGYNGEIKMEEWYEKGFIINMNDLFAQDSTVQEKDYINDTFHAGEVDGKLIGLPLTVNIPFYVVRDEFWYDSEFEGLPEDYTGRELYAALLNEAKKEQSEEMFFLIYRADIYDMLTQIGIINSETNQLPEEEELFTIG